MQNNQRNIQDQRPKILDVHNMLDNADKENFGYLGEKRQNVPLRPALRSSNHDSKAFKQIRFNISGQDLTPTPPPKDFKRSQNRKTLRNARCMSAIVTEKEKSLLAQPSPKAPQGFVKSMCRFYTDNFASKLNRSNSFSNGETSTESNESNRSHFSLFRSNSWSSRHGKTGKKEPENLENEPERSSPKSVDSGFSDFNSQRLEFLRSNMELFEDSQDPNLTQAASADFRPNISSKPKQNNDSANSKKLSQALSNIASMQTGLQMKRNLAEEDLINPLPAPDQKVLNLLRPNSDKIRPKSFIESVNDLSQISESGPIFSTPVRASFRGRRPHTLINLEDAKTPSKREAKTRLKELKMKRWSANIEDKIEPSLVAVWSQFVNYEPSGIPSSMVTPSINCGSSGGHLARAGQQQLTSEVVSVDDHLSLGQLSATQVSILGSENTILQCNSSNSMGGNEEAIIELEEMIPKTPVQPKSSGKINTSPVCEWWKDLHAWCEPECMTYLQSKPILVANSMSTSPTNSSSSTIEEDLFNKDMAIVNTMKQLQNGAKSIHVTFSSIDKHLSAKNFAHLGKSVQILLNQVQKYVFDYNMGKMGQSEDFLDSSCKNYEWNFPGLRKNVPANLEEEIKSLDQDGMKELVLLQQRNVLQNVDRLKLCAHRSQYTPNNLTSWAEMVKILGQLKKAFESLVDKMLVKELKPLVREIEFPSNCIGIRSALHSVIALGNEAGINSKVGNATCLLLAKEGCVKALLKQATQQKSQDLRILALRGLSSICCVADCIREFEKADGLRTIEQLLCSRGSLIEDRIEAAGVLAQITSPWISDNHKINHLDNYVYNMVNALTGLSRMNGGEETFLLVTAALANLTFMSPLSSAAMKRCGTPEALVKSVRRSPFTTLFAKDQVVTVLANMAANANCRHDIEAINGVGFLLSMLETKMSNISNQSEVSAAERVQKKSAIALSRLCNSTKVCRDLIRLNGIDRLVELCRNPSERNYSDGVLVSCLAVLRRLNANLEDEHQLKKILNQLKADDLVRPNLVDSFMEYSTKQESYV